MDFDKFTISLLILSPDAPKFSDAEENALQDAHMAYLAKLHEQGHLLAAGPILGAADRHLRGVSIFRGTPEEVKLLVDQDPGIIQGKFKHEFYSWIVPGGAVNFSPTKFPKAMSEI